MEKVTRVSRINDMEDKVKAKKIKNVYRYSSLVSMICSIFLLIIIIFFSSKFTVTTGIYLVVLIISLGYCGGVFASTFKMLNEKI